MRILNWNKWQQFDTSRLILDIFVESRSLVRLMLSHNKRLTRIFVPFPQELLHDDQGPNVDVTQLRAQGTWQSLFTPGLAWNLKRAHT